MAPQSILNFLQTYSGDNKFVYSLKKFHERNGMLTDKQILALERFMNKPVQPQSPKEEKEIKPMQESLFEVSATEILEDEMPQENISGLSMQDIENRIQSVSMKVLEETMREAGRRANEILQACTKLSLHKPLMHIKIGDQKVKQLTKEASPYLPKILVNAKLGFNTLLVGPAGTGKTTLAQQVSEALELPFGMLSCTAGMSESWLYGRQYANGTVEGLFSKMFREGGVFLLDEIDAADSNFMTGPNAALENGILFNPITNEMHKRHENFVCIAAANTYGLGGNAQYTGRNRLDAATLERFVTISIWYNEKLEEKLCENKKIHKKLVKAREKLKTKNAKEFISTRQFIRLPKLIAAGYTEAEAFGTFTDAWPEGLAKEVGLFVDQKEENESVPF